MTTKSSIESVLHEERRFLPPANFEERLGPAYVDSMEAYESMHRHALEDPSGFWGKVAENFVWFRPWDRVVEGKGPDTKWFVGGQTNLSYNCLDRQIEAGFGDETAILWEGEPMPGGKPEVRRLSYKDLCREVSRFANALRALGVKKGDIVTLYMGMVPELAVAMLACARIGAPHSVIFGGFSSQAIVDRVMDARSRVVVTCDGAWRRGTVVPLKEKVDEACAQLAGTEHAVRHVVVFSRCGNEVPWDDARDRRWEDLVRDCAETCPAEPMDSEDMLFLLYTSGSTGKPKGIVHTTGGYLVYAATTSRYVFNLVPGRGQTYWCTADIGWITGHSYIVYGILPNRVPTLMYEGAPNHPQPDRFWDIVERHAVTHFYTAPTAIRAFMKWGAEHPRGHDLSSLRLLGTVGEPINPEAWMWYHEVIGGGRCPIVDTWWQTETGGHILTPLPAATPTVPGSCGRPFIGVDAVVIDEQGRELAVDEGGLLAIRNSWPGMLRGIYGDRARFVETYWERVPGFYLAGDGARRDQNGNFWIMGRVDDVINVSGHRLGTMEIESALVSHEAVVEAAVVGVPHELKGTGIAAFCTLEPGHVPRDEADAKVLREALVNHVTEQIGAIAKPDMIRFADSLPKTRSGKIMRRLLRDIAAGREDRSQDTSTLEDYSVLARLRAPVASST